MIKLNHSFAWETDRLNKSTRTRVHAHSVPSVDSSKWFSYTCFSAIYLVGFLSLRFTPFLLPLVLSFSRSVSLTLVFNKLYIQWEKLNFLGERFFSSRITNAYKIDHVTHTHIIFDGYGPKANIITGNGRCANGTHGHAYINACPVPNILHTYF